jgi:integrase
MPIYQSKDRPNRYRIRVYHEGRPLTRDFEGSKKDAERFEARWRLELEAGAPASARAPLTLSDFCASHYFVHAEQRLGVATWKVQRFHLATLLLCLGDRRLTELSAADVDRFVSWRRKQTDARSISYEVHGIRREYERPAREKPVTNTTINNELRVLRRVLSFARERKFPVAELKVRELSQPTPRAKAWSDAELSRLFATCRAMEPELLPLVAFLANTGCRKGESLALLWENVDLAASEIRIWPSAEWRPKNGKAREVPIWKELHRVLSALPRNSPHVFVTRSGEPFKTFPARRFTRIVRAADLSGGPHRLRHTYASRFLAQQPDLGLLAAILGHSDEAVTRLYAWMLPSRLAKARDLVGIDAGKVALRAIAGGRR